MTVTPEATVRDAGAVLDAVRALAPTLRARAADIEAARRLPPDLVDALKATGCFRMLRPQSLGGAGATLAQALEVVETQARADASAGWLAMIGAASFSDLTGLPRATLDALFADRDVVFAGVFSPMDATIAAVDGGYDVSGRWGFASGCQHADWLYVNCIEGFDDDGPRLRAAVLRPDQVDIEDTWNVLGLCGTGSHHLRVETARVAPEYTFVPLTGEPSVDAAIARVPSPSVFALGIASVALGNARGALDDLLGLASAKVRLLDHATLDTMPGFHTELAWADTRLAAAAALVASTAESLWAAAERGEPITLEQRAAARAAAVWATTEATTVTTTAYRSGGGSAIYRDSPLPRRLRDAHAITQHFLVRADTMGTVGAILAGQDVSVLVF